VSGRVRWLALLGTPLAAGCVYYNAMWSAEHHERLARRHERRGQVNEARGQWLRAAVKAESVHVRHPASRWADDAWVLHAEALVRGGACVQARPAIAVALDAAGTDDLRERAALAAAECALHLGAPGEAGRYAAAALASRDDDRRSRARYLAARAAEARGDVAGALALYAASRERVAGPARVRLLLAAGQAVSAVALFDTIAAGPFLESEWTELVAATAAAAGTARGSQALDVVLERMRVPRAARARLLLADGHRRFAAGEFTAARDRYQRAAAAAGDLPEGEDARVRALRCAAALATATAALHTVRDELVALGRASSRPGAGPEGTALAALLARILDADTTATAAFTAAELARDSLRNPVVAGELFVAYARARPTSLFAPKALVAALTLDPRTADSLRAALDAAYPESPYRLALRGAPSPGYAALEDSLARAFGLTAVAPAAAAFVSRVVAPAPGARGPWWDDVFPWARIGAPAAAVARDTIPRTPDAGEPGRRPRPVGRVDPGERP
jgi:hypothetical protein